MYIYIKKIIYKRSDRIYEASVYEVLSWLPFLNESLFNEIAFTCFTQINNINMTVAYYESNRKFARNK